MLLGVFFDGLCFGRKRHGGCNERGVVDGDFLGYVRF